MPDAASPENPEALYGKAYFDGSYKDGALFEKRRGMYGQEFRRVTQFINEGNVLDVGCGLGEFLALFEEKRWHRYGTDISQHALNVAASKGVNVVLPQTCDAFFDLIIFRGSLQHLDEPLATIKKCIGWLRPGGYMVFLATPNSGGICYRLFQDLPMLDASRNFVVFSAKMLRNCLVNLGMEVVHVEFPYRGTPYAQPPLDLLRFMLRCFGIPVRFAFWGNMMECYARKPATP
jgi:SAM-dependent methyltransferase